VAGRGHPAGRAPTAHRPTTFQTIRADTQRLERRPDKRARNDPHYQAARSAADYPVQGITMATDTAAAPGIAPGELVRVAVPGRPRATASVTHVTATWLGLRLVGLDGPRARDLYGERGAVEFMAADGIHRLRGEVGEVEGSSTALRFVFRSGPQFLGRRVHLRTSLNAPVVVTVDSTREKFRGRTMNVSEGGMLVGDLDGNLPGPGTRVRFALAPRNARDPIFGAAVVIRVDKHRGVLAINFENLPRSEADALARLVYEHESESRSRRR
jgi:PilZ domain